MPPVRKVGLATLGQLRNTVYPNNAEDYCVAVLRELQRRVPRLKRHRYDGSLKMSNAEMVRINETVLRRRLPWYFKVVNYYKLRRFLLGPSRAWFRWPAPHQPRATQVTCYRTPRPLEIHVRIDGSNFETRLEFADAYIYVPREEGGRMPNHASTVEARRAARGFGEKDGAFVAERILDILDERTAILRMVHMDEFGPGSGLHPLHMDVIVSPEHPTQIPSGYQPVSTAVDAVLLTWSGRGDRRVKEAEHPTPEAHAHESTPKPTASVPDATVTPEQRATEKKVRVDAQYESLMRWAGASEEEIKGKNAEPVSLASRFIGVLVMAGIGYLGLCMVRYPAYSPFPPKVGLGKGRLLAQLFDLIWSSAAGYILLALAGLGLLLFLLAGWKKTR